MLKLEILAAEYGDCLWVEYGDPKAPRRILVDAGLASVYTNQLKPRLMALSDRDRKSFELMVCTHIDADHIGGTLKLFEEAGATGFGCKEVWFNGYRHLPDESPNTLGPVQGEQLTEMLVDPKWRWNASFKGAAVMVPDDGALPRFELEGGMVLTLLSPNAAKLAKLKPVWEDECRKAGLEPRFAATGEPGAEPEQVAVLGGGPPDVDSLADEKFSLDSSEANGSSIAFILEFEGRRLLLSGDAHPDVLGRSLKRWSAGAPPSVDLFKLPHHGSKANVSTELVRALKCKSWVFSSNGKKFNHPNAQAVARVIKYASTPELVFNYRTRFSEPWDNAALRRQHGYTAVYPPKGRDGHVIEFG
jgi:beta-lactamase superfamily II metal-dependent hydrolase